MVVCQFFLKGDCKFGDRCRNEHPGRPSQISAFGGGGTSSFGGGSGFGGGNFGGGNFGATNKNVCQYFLKGTCRYGNSCKFAHTKPATGIFGGQTNFGQHRNTSGFVRGGGNKNGLFYTNQNQFGVLGNEVTMGTGGQQGGFGGNKQQSSTEAILQNPTQMSQVQQIVRRDMEAWEASKQWPFSCYTYLKDAPCLVGLVDFSPEEIRKEAYDAKIGNKVSVYEQGLKNLLERSRQRRLELKNMNVHQLQTEIRASVSKQPGPQGGSSMSLQSAGQQSSSMFGSSAPMSQSQSVFGSPASQGSVGLFGSDSPSPQPMGTTFGSFPGSSPVTSSTANTGMFGSTSPSQPSTLFGSSSASQNAGVFGTTSTMNSGNTLFGATTSNTSPFGKQPAGGSGVFGVASTSQPAMNVFGNQSSGQTSTSEVAPSSCQLTCSEQDIAAFKADKFVLGQIPECPPPTELCN